jgi:hypothetical protein
MNINPPYKSLIRIKPVMILVHPNSSGAQAEHMLNYRKLRAHHLTRNQRCSSRWSWLRRGKRQQAGSTLLILTSPCRYHLEASFSSQRNRRTGTVEMPPRKASHNLMSFKMRKRRKKSYRYLHRILRLP